jgi:hypothetical protein
LVETVVVEARTYRTMWKRTIVANLLGIAVLLVGWGFDSGLLITLGFFVLVASLAYRVVTQVRASSRRK